MDKDLAALETIRKELQELDLQIVLLMLERYKKTETMGKVKKRLHLAALQEDEWTKKINFLSTHLEGNNRSKEILNIFYFIHNQSVEIQESMFKG